MRAVLCLVLASLLLLAVGGARNKTMRKLKDQVSQASMYSSAFFDSPQYLTTSWQSMSRLSTGQSSANMFNQDYYPTVLAQTGPIDCITFTKDCKHVKYRTYDGTCNNLRYPTLGAVNTVYSRLAPAKYADGIEMPPLSVSGKALPNARLLSVTFFPDVNIQDPQLTLAAMQWGQIITHDMGLAAGTTTFEQQIGRCCSDDGRTLSEEGLTARHCFPIMIPDDDPLYLKYQQGCMNLARSLTDRDLGCAPEKKPADQVVGVTHFMDASFIYGWNEDVAASLRTFEGGKLIAEYRRGMAWLPNNVNRTTSCPVQQPIDVCYLAGDVRVNQNTQLTVIQVILLREHNRVAEKLQEMNPHWNDEKIYQETRKILIGEVQFISYYEWLPLFLGTKNLLNYGVIYDPIKNLYVNDYNELVDPRSTNEHATGAFRAFHTNIQGFLRLITEERRSRGAVRLSDFFNNPSVLEYEDNFNDLLRGLVTQPQRASDVFHTAEITDFLFRDTQPFGSDLKAIDIQRARDHGLPSYNTMREYCGLKRAKIFEDFMDYLTVESVQKLKSLYEHPEDVDLNVGGILERLLPGSRLGPTYQCIVLEQFYRTRVGDRYFFENDQHMTAFTPEQLTEIKKSSYSRLMCDNAKEVYSMQPRGFVRISKSNPLRPCSDFHEIPQINLEAWREFDEHHEFRHSFYKK